MRSRKFFITLWSSIKDKETNEEIQINLLDYVEKLSKKYILSYIIHNKEQEEKEHVHIYINNNTQIDFDTLKRINKYAHIEKAIGNDKQIYLYMLHKDIKSIENGKQQYEEKDIKGNYKYDLDEKKKIGEELIKDITSGLTLWEVIQNNPNLWLHVDKIKQIYEIYQMYLKDHYLIMELIEQEGKIITRDESNNNINNNSSNNIDN